MPKKLLKEIHKSRRRFLWKQDEEITCGSCKVNWSAVCTPTSHGGLGILDLERFSRALRLRWLWTSWTDPERAWVGTEPPCSAIDTTLFRAVTTVTIGDGATALFWHSSWSGPHTLAASYPLLYSHSRRKNRTVREALTGETWIKDLRHGNLQPLLQEFIRLHRTISLTVLTDGRRDKIRWTLEASGLYSASSAYAVQFQGRVQVDWQNLIWEAKVSGCIKIFTWLLLKNRLWTCDRLQRLGWPNSYFCLLCVRDLETAHHLFWSCPVARKVWEKVAARQGCQQLHPRQQV